MKVEVKGENELQGLPYPKLMYSIHDKNLIVLFNSDKCGVVINGVGDRPKGMYRTDWFTNKFRDFKGSITITQ